MWIRCLDSKSQIILLLFRIFYFSFFSCEALMYRNNPRRHFLVQTVLYRHFISISILTISLYFIYIYLSLYVNKGVWNRREIQLTRAALPYDYTCFADSTLFEQEIFVWCTITAYTITYSEYFLYKWSTRLQSMHYHMVGRAASVVSPSYSILLETYEFM